VRREGVSCLYFRYLNATRFWLRLVRLVSMQCALSSSFICSQSCIMFRHVALYHGWSVTHQPTIFSHIRGRLILQLLLAVNYVVQTSAMTMNCFWRLCTRSKGTRKRTWFGVRNLGLVASYGTPNLSLFSQNFEVLILEIFLFIVSMYEKVVSKLPSGP
jgi:hypothetical protein